MRLIYPKWPKLEGQTEFHLPPHGPVNFAATVPEDVDLVFIDENREEIPFDTNCDIVAISMMLTCQVKRGWAIADKFRELGVTVIFGGISTQLHAEETMQHADSVFLGESETRTPQVLEDFKNGQLKPVYDYHNDFPPIETVVKADRSILNYDHYTYRGLKMVDLVHASRGCRFNCEPCCTSFLGGRKFRPRVIDQVVEEIASIDNDRLFIVDNSLAQNKEWEIELFKAIAPLKKKWCCHPIENDPEVLKYAAEAGAWYVYQAVWDTSDYIRDRIKRYKDFGIGVEGTITLGLDDHDEDYIKRLVDFLLEVDLDLAEFTVLTPFPHTQFRTQLEEEGRVLSNDWDKYNAGQVVFQPKHMSVDKLQQMYEYAWDEFYKDTPQRLRMARLYNRIR